MCITSSQSQLLHHTEVMLGQSRLDGSIFILKEQRMQICFGRKR